MICIFYIYKYCVKFCLIDFVYCCLFDSCVVEWELVVVVYIRRFNSSDVFNVSCGDFLLIIDICCVYFWF